jgi:CRISPR-associated endonuclease/helicase Cas3
MLFAKSGNPPYLLEEHTSDVLKALREIRKIWAILPKILDNAAIFHDLGKAASGFQSALLNNSRWGFRHEVLSAAIFRDCHNLSDEETMKAYLSLLTHHKNLGTNYRVSDSFLFCQSTISESIWCYKWKELQHNELKELFKQELSHWNYIPSIPSPANEVNFFITTIKPIFEDLLQGLMRGALVAADHLASSGLSSPLHGNNIKRELLEKYAKDNIFEWNGWNYVQNESEKKGKNGNVLLTAPTGIGKTEASLLWALKNRRGSERIFYVLPYQVSINSMAERLSAIFPNEDGSTVLHENNNISILHSNTSSAYFQDALNDEVGIKKALQLAQFNKNAAKKIYSPIKVTTVYQLLNVFFGQKFFEVGLLELTNSIIIFDEIHAYDGHTLGLITIMLKYLNKLGARIFIMTATLPSKLKEELCDAASITKHQIVSIKDDDNIQTEERRKIIIVNSLIENDMDFIEQTIENEFNLDKKIVIVSNTVSKAIRICERLKKFEPLLIHSRFTLQHRNERESKGNINKHRIVISTQVIEVSLDISFDIMFTELAPADSLLQRFGRVNRHGVANENNLGLCYVYIDKDKGSNNIYDPLILKLTVDYMPKTKLCFKSSCEWIENVYPNGLSQNENEKKKSVSVIFEHLISQLKPMIDSPIKIDMEDSLLSSIEVIPLQFEEEWKKCKLDGDYLLAKRLTVNLSYPSWRSAIKKYKDQYDAPGFKIDNETDKYKTTTIAYFFYDDKTGLRLDKPISPFNDISNFI